MNIFNKIFKQAAFAATFASTFAIVSCQDHRLSPTEQTTPGTLPDRTFYALSDNGQLHEINVQNTSTPLRSFAITGLEAGEALVGIDFRPATGQLYAIGNKSNLYQVNVKSGDQQGKATKIGVTLSTLLAGTNIGFDFNPTVDRIRIVSNTGQNFRVHPETGALAFTDGPLNGPASPKVGAVAYTNSRSGATATTLYDIDPVADMLYTQNPPNNGVLIPVSGLGLDIEDVGGFDISPDVNAADVYPIASVKVSGAWELDYVNLTTGKLQKLGNFPTGVNIIGIAIPSLPVAYALLASNSIKIFNPTTGSDYGTKTVGGLPTGVMLLGIDIRPANGRLYSLGSNSKIYGIDLGTGAATEVSSLVVTLTNTPAIIDGTYFGVDFNPAADRLRVVSNTGQSLRIDVSTGGTTVDGSINGTGVTPYITAVAYSNSYPGVVAANTVLFDIDSQSDILYKQNPPNVGTLIEGKNLNVNVEPNIGFDIGNVSGTGYAIFTVGGATTFNTIDLTSGVVQSKYTFSSPVKGLAVGFGL